VTNLTPHLPANRPLIWSDAILDLQELLLDVEPHLPLYIVGGAVRDAFLHRATRDIDFVTPEYSIRLAKRIADKLNADVFILDQERGVARVIWQTPNEKLVLDVARYRGDDLLADIMGRDFTVNTMLVDARDDLNLLIDPLNGERDAEDRLLRACTPQSLADDPIRVLRAIRQSVQLSFRIEPETLKQVREYASSVVNTSGERVRDELFNVLKLGKASAALRVMQTVGLLQAIIPEIDTLINQPQPAPHVFDAWAHTLYAIEKLQYLLVAISPRRTDNSVASFDMGMLVMQLDRFRQPLIAHIDQSWANERPHIALLTFTTLFHAMGEEDAPNIARLYSDELKLSNPEKKRVVGALANYKRVFELDPDDVLEVHRFWYRLGEIGVDAVFLAVVDYLATYGVTLVQADWLRRVEGLVKLLWAYFKDYERVVLPPPLLQGNELIEAFSLPQGRIIGQLLDAIREGQVLGTVENREDAFALARQILAK